MRDLSMHVLDIAQNSVKANAKTVSISFTEDVRRWLTIVFTDDGDGMAPELLKKVTDPFTTTRTTRKVGLGIPLIKENAELTGGTVTIESEPGKGTTLTATFDLNHIDCPPMGEMCDTLLTLVLLNPDKPDFVFHVRVGEAVHSPLVGLAGADYLLSFEALEGARAAGYLKPDGVLIVNTQRISPMSVITGAAQYPENPLSGPELQGIKVEALDALRLAEEAGSPKAVNLVLLGKLSGYLPFSDQAWQQAIAVSVPRKTLDVNVRAFESGRQSGTEAANA